MASRQSHTIHTLREGNWIAVARILLGEDGKASVEILDAQSGIGPGLIKGSYSRSLDRPVTPEDGQAFIDAVREDMSNSTYCRFEDDPVEGRPVQA